MNVAVQLIIDIGNQWFTDVTDIQWERLYNILKEVVSFTNNFKLHILLIFMCTHLLEPSILGKLNQLKVAIKHTDMHEEHFYFRSTINYFIISKFVVLATSIY